MSPRKKHRLSGVGPIIAPIPVSCVAALYRKRFYQVRNRRRNSELSFSSLLAAPDGYTLEPRRPLNSLRRISEPGKVMLQGESLNLTSIQTALL